MEGKLSLGCRYSIRVYGDNLDALCIQRAQRCGREQYILAYEGSPHVAMLVTLDSDKFDFSGGVIFPRQNHPFEIYNVHALLPGEDSKEDGAQGRLRLDILSQVRRRLA